MKKRTKNRRQQQKTKTSIKNREFQQETNKNMNKSGRHNGKHTPTHEKRTRKEQTQTHIDRNNKKIKAYIGKSKEITTRTQQKNKKQQSEH